MNVIKKKLYNKVEYFERKYYLDLVLFVIVICLVVVSARGAVLIPKHLE